MLSSDGIFVIIAGSWIHEPEKFVNLPTFFPGVCLSKRIPKILRDTRLIAKRQSKTLLMG